MASSTTSGARGGATASTGVTSGSTTTSGTTSMGGTSGTGGAGGSIGGTNGSGGTRSGSGGNGGVTGGADAGDASRGGSAGASSAMDSGLTADGAFPPLTECTKPSIDRIEQWVTSAPAEGTTIPPSGNLVVMEGDHYVAKVQFIINNGAYCVCPVYVNNSASAPADLSTSTGFLLTYSSTADMHVQVRPTTHWNGGDQWATLIPSTGGVKKSQFFSFAPANWKSIFGTPTWTFASALQEVEGFVFVGNIANVVTFYGLRFDGFTPTCR